MFGLLFFFFVCCVMLALMMLAIDAIIGKEFGE